jgi:hypothetical protein
MLIKDENTLLAIGMASLFLSFIIGFVHVDYIGFSVSDFVEGMLAGISLSLNLTFLIKRRLNR